MGRSAFQFPWRWAGGSSRFWSPTASSRLGARSSSIACGLSRSSWPGPRRRTFSTGGTTHRASLRPSSGRPGTTPPWPTRSLRGSSRSAFLMMGGLRSCSPAPRPRLDGGGSKIERELARRGVDVTQLEGWPSDYLEEDESETAFALASPQASFGQERLPEARSLPLRARVSHGCGHRCRKEGPCGGRGGLRRCCHHPPTEHMI